MPNDAAVYSVSPFLTADSIASNAPESSRLFATASHHEGIASNSPPPPPLTQMRPRPRRLPIREVSREGLGGGASIASALVLLSICSVAEVVLEPDPDAELDSAGVTVFGVDCPLAIATGAGASELEGIGEADTDASLELATDAGAELTMFEIEGF